MIVCPSKAAQCISLLRRHLCGQGCLLGWSLHSDISFLQVHGIFQSLVNFCGSSCYQRSNERLLRANAQEKQKDGSDHIQLVMILSQGSRRNKHSLSNNCSAGPRQCALVLRWLWMLSLEPAVRAAAWLDLPLSPLTAHPHILEGSYLGRLPAKPLQLHHK